jgi:hypothetical protein
VPSSAAVFCGVLIDKCGFHQSFGVSSHPYSYCNTEWC